MKNGEKLIVLTDAGHEEPLAVKPEKNPATTAGDVLRLAIERGADTDQLERLLNLELRWRAYQAELAFQQDFLGFKQEPELKILKDELIEFENRDGSTTKYSYSPLDRAETVLIPLLAKHNITHSWRLEPQSNNDVRVTCVLKHLLCHVEEGAALQGPPDASGRKNFHQAIGSNVSYLQRYTLCAACGITPKNVDTDARTLIEAEAPKVNGNGVNDRDQTPILQASIKMTLEAKVRACGTRPELDELWADLNKEQREAMRPVFNERRIQLNSAKEGACK